MNQPSSTTCLHCKFPLTIRLNIDIQCEACMAPDDYTSYLVNVKDGQVVYLSIYFKEIDLGANVRFDENTVSIFDMCESTSDMTLLHHKVFVQLHYIPEFDYSDRAGFMRQLQIYTTFS